METYSYWADSLNRVALLTQGCYLDRCAELGDDGSAVYVFVPFWDEVLNGREDCEIFVEWRGDADAFDLVFDNVYRQAWLSGRA